MKPETARKQRRITRLSELKLRFFSWFMELLEAIKEIVKNFF
jgi:hypothetical protein